MKPVGIAVVGCGLIGKRRAQVARSSGLGRVIVVGDVDAARAEALARECDCLAMADWREAISLDGVEAVIVSTINCWLAPIAIAALQAGKHVLVEKPMACTVSQAEAMMAAASRFETKNGPGGNGRDAACLPGLVAAVGFNHRHHGAVHRAYELFQSGVIGDALYIRSRYGHGGRPGMEKEWRADPEVAGGGELLDQGVHAIDLFRLFLGEFTEASGFTGTYVWGPGGSGAAIASDTSGGVEDNAFALFRTAAGQVASLHASWTQWQNLFSFELFGRRGYLIVEGLGGSYGPERLRVGRRALQGGPPAEEVLEFNGPDVSWEAEWREFVAAIREKRPPWASVCDGLQAVKMVHAVYESSRTGQVIRL